MSGTWCLLGVALTMITLPVLFAALSHSLDFGDVWLWVAYFVSMCALAIVVALLFA